MLYDYGFHYHCILTRFTYSKFVLQIQQVVSYVHLNITAYATAIIEMKFAIKENADFKERLDDADKVS